MRRLEVPFEQLPSKIFGIIHRPIIPVNFWSFRVQEWREVIMLIDTGADYSLLPKFYAEDLGVDIKKDCFIHQTVGIGGAEKVYIHPRLKVSIGDFELRIPVGFLDRDDIPPLLGRHHVMDQLKGTFHHHRTYIEKS